MLLNCFIGYCQNNDTTCFSTGNLIQSDTARIAIAAIRVANNKLIEGKYYKEISKEQEQIIRLKNSYIVCQDSIIKDMQNRVIKTTDINNKLQEDYNRQKRKTVVGWSVAASTSVLLVATIVGLIYK